MGSKLDTERLNLVFQRRPDILTGIRKAAGMPEFRELFTYLRLHKMLSKETLPSY